MKNLEYYNNNILVIEYYNNINVGITDVTVYVRLIEDASGCDKIENLQIHENPLVCEKSYTILENDFREEDDT